MTRETARQGHPHESDAHAEQIAATFISPEAEQEHFKKLRRTRTGKRAVLATWSFLVLGLVLSQVSGPLGLFTESPAQVATRPVSKGYASLDQPMMCTPGSALRCYTSRPGVCGSGIQHCRADGFWGSCVSINPPVLEVPSNGTDDDCDGIADES